MKKTIQHIAELLEVLFFTLIIIIDFFLLENTNNLHQSKEDWIKIAQENNGAYYVIDQEVYAELDLDIGTAFIVYYDGEGESNPPVRFAEKIELISK